METSVNLIATAGRLVVKKLPEGNETSGGLVLAKPVNADIHRGVVESIGALLKDETQEFELGSTVVWSNYSGVEYEYEGETYVIINQKDIIAIEK